jgi:hypothetical protein
MQGQKFVDGTDHPRMQRVRPSRIEHRQVHDEQQPRQGASFVKDYCATHLVTLMQGSRAPKRGRPVGSVGTLEHSRTHGYPKEEHGEAEHWEKEHGQTQGLECSHGSRDQRERPKTRSRFVTFKLSSSVTDTLAHGGNAGATVTRIPWRTWLHG